MNANKALWEKGDFTQIAGFMRQSGEAVVNVTRESHPRCGFWTWAAEMALQRFRWPIWGPKLLGST